MDPDQRRLIMGQYQRSNTFDTASIPTKMLSTAGRRVLAEYEALHGPTPPIYGPKGMARRLALEGFENGHGRAAEQEVVAIQFKTEK